MKVVHLSTYDHGGAAVAAQRLHFGLLKSGVDSTFLSLKSSAGFHFPGKHAYATPAVPLLTKVLKRAGLPLTHLDRNVAQLKKRKGNYEAFSFPVTDYRVEKHPLVEEADIVHLHWVSNFINFPSFFERIRKPIVWTFHDLNPLLGGFHYLEDKERNERVFGKLEEQLTTLKREAIGHTANLAFASPSKWILEYLQRQTAFKTIPASHIYYGLDLDVFKPVDKTFARSVFNLPAEKKIILFVSERLDNYRKGYDLLQEALHKIDMDSSFMLVAVGAQGRNGLVKSDRIHPVGKIGDERLMSLLFSAADVFVLPSREDNLPNVMLESMACGTPVLAFEVGGMKDVIQPGVTGLLAPDVTSASMAAVLEDFMSGRTTFQRDVIRQFACDHFSLSHQAEQYLGLYNRMLSRSDTKGFPPYAPAS